MDAGSLSVLLSAEAKAAHSGKGPANKQVKRVPGRATVPRQNASHKGARHTLLSLGVTGEGGGPAKWEELDERERCSSQQAHGAGEPSGLLALYHLDPVSTAHWHSTQVPHNSPQSVTGLLGIRPAVVSERPSRAALRTAQCGNPDYSQEQLVQERTQVMHQQPFGQRCSWSWLNLKRRLPPSITPSHAWHWPVPLQGALQYGTISA